MTKTFTVLSCGQSVTGGTMTVTLRVNGVNTGTACTTTNALTTSVSGAYPVNAGDLVTVSAQHTTTTNRSVYWAPR